MNFKEQEITVYSNEYGFSTRLSKRDLSTDEWHSAFLYVQFKKGVSVPNKTKIKILDSWLSFYISKSGKTVLYMFINDFEIIDTLD